MKIRNSATRFGAAVRSLAFAGAPEKTIRGCAGATEKTGGVPGAWSGGSHAAMSASPGMVVGLEPSQLIETRFTFSPTSFSVVKNETPASPPDLPVSSLTPTSSAARAASVTANVSSAQTHSSKPLFVLNLVLLVLGAALSQVPTLFGTQG